MKTLSIASLFLLSSTHFVFGQNTFPSSGNVGIGTSTPGAALEVNGNISLPSSTGNKSIYTWNATDANWRMGMSVTPGFTTSMSTSHVQYFTYGNGPGQGFAVGVNGGQSSFEILGSNHTAFFRGNVGVGTATPTAKLEINQMGGVSGQNQGLKIWAGNSYNYFGNSQLQFSYGGGGGSYSHAVKSRHNSAAVSGNAIDFYLWQPGDPMNGEGSLYTMTLNGGNVGIGTSIPDQKLTVKGIIHAQEVRVDLSVPGPDYVFGKNYKLLSLSEIKSYIDQNKHLPEVPSAAEMEKNGLQLGEMNMLLLKKVEELTLYVIELKNRDETQQREIDWLKKEATNTRNLTH